MKLQELSIGDKFKFTYDNSRTFKLLGDYESGYANTTYEDSGGTKYYMHSPLAGLTPVIRVEGAKVE